MQKKGRDVKKRALVARGKAEGTPRAQELRCGELMDLPIDRETHVNTSCQWQR